MSEEVPTFLEIDGEDVHPHTVDSRLAADLVKTFMDLLSRSAVLRGVPLELKGLMIEDKCFRVAMESSAPELSRKAMEAFGASISGKDRPDSKKDRDLIRHFNVLVGKIAKNPQVKIGVGGWTQHVVLHDDLPPLEPPTATTLRVRLLKVGVQPATARFSSESEDLPFTLHITDELARELGRFIDEDLDLEFEYRRDRLGHIEDGELIAYHPMETEGGADWLRWLDEARKGRNGVDIAEELGRRDD